MVNRFFYTIRYRSLETLFVISVIFGPALGYYHFYLFHLVLSFICFLLLSTEKKIINYAPVSNLYFGAFLFLLFWYFIGLSWSDYKLYTLQYLVYLILGISIIFIFSTWVTTIERYKYIFTVIRNIVIVEYIVSILEMLRIFRWPTSPFSKYAALFGRAQKDIANLPIEGILFNQSKPTGFTGNPNDLAVFIVMVLPFFLFSSKKYMPILGTLLSLTIIIFITSRGVFLAFCVGMAIYFFLKKRRTFFILVIAMVIIFSIGMGTSVVDELTKSENRNISRVASAFSSIKIYLSGEPTRDHSTSERRQLITNGINEFKNTQGLGVGGGASKAIQESKYGLSISSMHNFWVEILVEAGIIGFVVFVIWYLFMIYKLFFISKKTKNNFVRYISSSLLLSMIVFSIGCISSSSVIYNLTMWLMFGMGISIIFIDKQQKANRVIE